MRRLSRAEKAEEIAIGMAVCGLMAAIVAALAWVCTGFAFNLAGRIGVSLILLGSLPCGAGMSVCDYQSGGAR